MATVKMPLMTNVCVTGDLTRERYRLIYDYLCQMYHTLEINNIIYYQMAF
jgi:hypothetical protein